MEGRVERVFDHTEKAGRRGRGREVGVGRGKEREARGSRGVEGSGVGGRRMNTALNRGITDRAQPSLLLLT